MWHLCLEQETAYVLRISDWSSDVCSSDLLLRVGAAFEKQFDRLAMAAAGRAQQRGAALHVDGVHRQAEIEQAPHRDRKRVVWGKRASVRLELSGRRFINKKQHLRLHRVQTSYLELYNQDLLF